SLHAERIADESPARSWCGARISRSTSASSGVSAAPAAARRLTLRKSPASSSSRVPTHSNGLGPSNPSSERISGMAPVHSNRSAPKIFDNSSGARNGARQIYTDRHLGQRPHHEPSFWPRLQLLNAVKYSLHRAKSRQTWSSNSG